MGLIAVLAVAAAMVTTAPGAIEANGPDGPLEGTLIGFAGVDRPVALILPGSGPIDRDGNSPPGLQSSVYRLLAEGLAARGIATVRVDKRGMYGSEGAARDANAATIEDYVTDAFAWIEAIRNRTHAPCVWLIGHSEGGLVALAAAARDPAPICGLVLAATPGRPFGEVLKAQFADIPEAAPFRDKADAAIARLEAGERVDASTLPIQLSAIFHPSVQGFLISACAVDPAKLMGAVRKPVLILQGDRDLKLGPADAEALGRADPAATVRRLPGVNHLLKLVVSADRDENRATYSDPGLPLAPGVIDAIADFMTARSAH